VSTPVSTLDPVSSLTETGWPITSSVSGSHPPAISPSEDGSSSPSRSVGVVIGVAVVATVAGAGISAVVFFCMLRRRRDPLVATLTDSDQSCHKWVDPGGGAVALW
jgi:hypothetical protein